VLGPQNFPYSRCVQDCICAGAVRVAWTDLTRLLISQAFNKKVGPGIDFVFSKKTKKSERNYRLGNLAHSEVCLMLPCPS